MIPNRITLEVCACGLPIRSPWVRWSAGWLVDDGNGVNLPAILNRDSRIEQVVTIDRNRCGIDHHDAVVTSAFLIRTLSTLFKSNAAYIV